MKHLFIGVFILFSVLVTAQIRIKAVGDVMLGSVTPNKVLPVDSGRAYCKISSQLKNCDVVFGNFEGALIKGDEQPEKCKKIGYENCYEFGMPIYLAQNLKTLGFDVMSMNNNHTADYGIDVYNQTVNVLKSLEIVPAAKEGFAELNIKGNSVAVIAFGNGTGVNFVQNIKSAKVKVTELKKNHKYVIVSFHSGKEGNSAVSMLDEIENYRTKKGFSIIKFSRAVIDAGADVVFGSGPHVLRPLELYKGKLIAYSLGNFLTYGNISLNKYCGIAGVLSVDLAEDGSFIKGRLIPTKQIDIGVPIYDDDYQSVKLLQTLNKNYGSDKYLRIEDGGMIYKK